MKKVFFLLHPISVKDFYKKTFFYFPFNLLIKLLLLIFPSRIIKKFYSSLSPHTILKTIIKTADNEAIILNGIMCPMFPDEIAIDKKLVEKKINNALLYALNKGSDIIVLTGFTSIAFNQGINILNLKEKGVCVTSGNTYTAYLCIEGMKYVCKMFNKDMDKAKVAVIGASGDIGSVCARLLAPLCQTLILSSRNINTCYDLLEYCKKKSNNLIVEKDLRKACISADLIFIATSSFVPLIGENDLKPSTIVCDVSLPFNVESNLKSKRGDVFVFDGGKAKFTGISSNRLWLKFVEDSGIFGCIAEGIILGLEKINVDFSIKKGEIKENNIDYISKLSQKHGFQLADLSFHGEKYKKEELDFYIKYFNNSKRS